MFHIGVFNMLFRMFIVLIGHGLAVSGGVNIILYLNLLTIGNGIMEYVTFISTKWECLLLPIGILIITLGIFFPKNRSDD